jgi:hypothetical protein
MTLAVLGESPGALPFVFGTRALLADDRRRGAQYDESNEDRWAHGSAQQQAGTCSRPSSNARQYRDRGSLRRDQSAFETTATKDRVMRHTDNETEQIVMSQTATRSGRMGQNVYADRVGATGSDLPPSLPIARIPCDLRLFLRL